MAYNYYNNNLEKRIFSAFKLNDGEKSSWKLNENLLNHIDPGQAVNQRQGTPFLVEPTITIDPWWSDTEYEFHKQHQQSAPTLSNFSVYSDTSNTTDQEYPKKFIYAPPGLLPSTSNMVRPVLLQDTLSPLPEHHLLDRNQKKQNILRSKSVNQQQQQQQTSDCFKNTYFKVAGKCNKENGFFYEDVKSPTWSEVISQNSNTKTNQAYKPKSAIDTQIIQQLLKKEDSPSVSMSNENSVASSNSTSLPVLKNMNNPKYITDSVYLMSSINNNIDFNNTSIERPYVVVRVSNIPWGLNIDSIKRVFQTCKFTELPSKSELPQAVHILMDVKTGKTTGVAYVEAKFPQHSNKEDIAYIISTFKLLCTQSRRVLFELSSYDQLCNELFSSWKGKFQDGKALPYSNQDTESKAPSFFMDQKDLQSLLNICRHYKVHYNRRCPERPFEYLITVIMNVPWKQAKIITTIQRDIIYECYKLVTEALRIHTNKPLHSFDSGLLNRLVRVAILCDGFTIKQKSIILKNANLECPEDLQIYLQEPPLVNDRELTSFFDC